GQFIGGKPVYGYKMHPTEKNKIVIDEAAAPVVQRIFAMALEGTSCRQIAAALNTDEVPTPAVYAGLPQSHAGPYAGLWSSERISDMLQNETYIGNMVQGRSVKISYKSKKCQKQAREDWVVVEGTHKPLIDPAVFQKVGLLLRSRRHTRSRTYDFLLKGLICCHECGCPMAVLNRPNAKGEDVLYFVCRTYQRFTKGGICTCHSIKEKTVTDAVTAKVWEVCRQCLNKEELIPLAEQALERARKEKLEEKETNALTLKLRDLTARMDQMYLDKLSGILDHSDFERMYPRLKAERGGMEEKLEKLRQPDARPLKEDQAEQLVQRFLDGIPTNRELLVSLIERVELTQDKQIIIRFRGCPMETTK
ncbi:MAG: recombinase family protein, partial [Lawsonibacter sp.]|nr:recombinase family protein [Lawsonibacter sp.]